MVLKLILEVTKPLKDWEYFG